MSAVKAQAGASSILVAFGLVLFLGMAAFAIDVGFGLSERRDDVTAADVGVMAGAVDSLASNAVVRDQILSFTRQNLPTAYSNTEWQALWEGCTDPELSTLNASGHQFIPVTPPAGWTVSSPWCISIDPAGFVRVRLPGQAVATSFGRVLGVNQLQTTADAIARWAGRGGGGLLPFGLLSNAAEGTHVCLRDASGGHLQEPCDGPDAGNFGAIESPIFGNEALGTVPVRECNGSPLPKKDELAINIALGVDHRIVPDPVQDSPDGSDLRDTCGVINGGDTPDALNTFQGLSNGTAEGLATGPVLGGFTPRLQQGGNPKRNIHGPSLDDRPLWNYIDGSLTSPAIPASCVRSTFDNSLADFDWDGDTIADRPESFQHMSRCLTDFVAAGSTTVLFLESISTSPRFSYVPQFWADAFPSGNGWRDVLRFKATWLQTTWWRKGASTEAFNPGEAGTFTAGGNWHLVQLSGLVIPDATLAPELRGTPGPSGGLNPFIPELWR